MQFAGNAGLNQPVHSHRLIRACVARKLHKGPFSLAVHHLLPSAMVIFIL